MWEARNSLPVARSGLLTRTAPPTRLAAGAGYIPLIWIIAMPTSNACAVCAPTSEPIESQFAAPAWLHQVFSAMDALRAAGGGTAIVQCAAGQYLMSVQPTQLEGGVA